MKGIKRDVGYEIQIGDLVVCKTDFGVNHNKITRVTPKYAFSKVNDNYQIKFPRIIGTFFHSLPRDTWSRNTYTVYTIKENN